MRSWLSIRFIRLTVRQFPLQLLCVAHKRSFECQRGLILRNDGVCAASQTFRDFQSVLARTIDRQKNGCVRKIETSEC
ncbi:hypothetical protein Rcae01_00010 [Novipirellula caenicola]|uniref:Secreted protein n=1 Tax=Novipirellula caenicola TaxID=1536901 RepID=A0ABP9VH75_9BACT